MRLKLFNGGVTTINVDVLAGAFDNESGMHVVIVKGNTGHAGTLSLEPKEAAALVKMLASTEAK